MSVDSLGIKSQLKVDNKVYSYFSLEKAGQKLGINIKRLPCSLKILLENLLRNEDGRHTKLEDIKALANCVSKYNTSHSINFKPIRVLMQDFTGVPAIVDLASMRDYVKKHQDNPEIINPNVPVDLIIDHSVQVDAYGNSTAFEKNVSLELKRNIERYEFLKWGQSAFKNFRVVPPGTGICHQVNLEYLAKVIWSDGELVFPDTLIGTDSHTTMINALSVLGWGVGGIEAEAIMLGQAITMLIPEVIGFKLIGKLREGVTATDLVLTITHILRKKGVVSKFVEYYGDGLNYLSIADRATISNMSPEYGATCGFFPIDQKTLDYLYMSGRDQQLIDLIESYAKTQYLWREDQELSFFDTMELNLSEVQSVMAGPKRPQDKILTSEVASSFYSLLSEKEQVFLKSKRNEEQELEVDLKRADDEDMHAEKDTSYSDEHDQQAIHKQNYSGLENGCVVIAAITSCTNTSNPDVMIAAGLVASKAVSLGLKVKPWVKTSLAPGSKVVTEYFNQSGLQKDLDALGFNLVGYGCTTCIGNSGPLEPEIEEEITKNNLTVVSVLSGNRNFEGRVNPFVKANYLASPPLVVIFALAGTININVMKDPICKDSDGKNIYINDLWPTNQQIKEVLEKYISKDMFIKKYHDVFSGDRHWKEIKTNYSIIYEWNSKSTYVQNPPYFEHLTLNKSHINHHKAVEIKNARALAIFGDSITTDHISPAGNIPVNSPAGQYLLSHKIEEDDFNSYGSRRGNHNVMMRGTFANIRVHNEMIDTEGGKTKCLPSGEEMSIFDAAMHYIETKVPLIIIAGKEYGSGSSRDWAAKGPLLLNVKAVIAESFERIHRSNLVGMGILPLTFKEGQTRKTLNICGDELFYLKGKADLNNDFDCTITHKDGSHRTIQLKCNLKTLNEVDYYNAGGVLHYVLLKAMSKRSGISKN